MPSLDGTRSGNRPVVRAVCAGMDHHRRLASLVAALLLALLVAGCAASGAASPAPTAVSTDPPAVESPSDGGTEPSVDPGVVGAKPVVPQPGQLDVHQVPIDSLAARVDGSTVVVRPVWTSGVEPCTILDHVEVVKGDGTMSIALFEGRGPGDAVCIAIAEQHTTVVEIPDVPAGTWTIVDATGTAPPVEVTVG
jgi:hypothetical protein